MTTRKSKKGFHKLENHELAEFTSLGNGALESGSENDLLDLTNVEVGEPRGRWNSCGCWCSCLFFGILTCLFLLVGVYCGYLTYNLWLMADDTSNTHSDLNHRLALMESELNKYKSVVGKQYSGLKSELLTLKETINTTHEYLMRYHDNMGKSISDLDSRVSDVDTRLKLVESKPQEILFKQVDLINKDMGVLSDSMRKLNTSLSDINQVKIQIAELGSITSRYDDQLIQVKTGIAEVRQDTSGMKASVDAAVETVADFKGKFDALDSGISSNHEQMKQTTDLLSAQLTDVQERVSWYNDTLNNEVYKLLTNITNINSTLEELTIDLSTVEEIVLKMLNEKPDSMETLDHTPTAPPMHEVSTTDHTPTTPPTQEVSTTEVDLVTSHDTEDLPTTRTTEQQSTSATEDNVPINSNTYNIETTAAINEEDSVEKKFVTEQEINRTQGAITYLQAVVDNYSALDVDDSETLDLEEFQRQIPKPIIFEMLDTSQDGFLDYDEVLTSIDNLRHKLYSLEAILKTLSHFEEGPTDDEGVVSTTAEELLDPVLQKKLKELYQYINSHAN